jgi:4-hydroxy-tetrahydrodipicolinate synthase
MSSQDFRERLRTVQIVPLSSFADDHQLNLTPMRQLIERLYAAGVRTFIPCAGSSEFHTMSADEIVAAVRMVRETVGADATVVAPVGLQLQHAIEIGSRSVDAGANAMLVMPLAFPYLSDAGARDYYETLMSKVACPAIIYKKARIPSDCLLLEMADHANFVGVKYSVNDIDQFHQTVQLNAGRQDWFCGNAERYAPFFALAGATGYTSGAGNICPRITLAMHQALSNGNWSEALRLQRIILPIENYRARDDSSYNVSFLKYAIRHTGLDFGPPRPPYRRLTESEQREIDQIVLPILKIEAELSS